MGGRKPIAVGRIRQAPAMEKRKSERSGDVTPSADRPLTSSVSATLKSHDCGSAVQQFKINDFAEM